MANEIPQDVSEKLEKYRSAKQILDAEARQVLVRTATFVADALANKIGSVRTIDTEPLSGFEAPSGPVPTEIPALEWESGLYVGQDEHGIDSFEKLTIICSVGVFASRQLDMPSNATAFDTGFYAGVLAAKEGLVDVDKFIHDSELPNSLDFLNE